jgi:hypothetical protein
MAKPYIHAKSSAKKFGGVPEDYLDIHQKMDSSKGQIADARHRMIFHSAFGCFIIEDIFGVTRTNSEGKEYSVRDVAEQHIKEDLGMIPSFQDYIQGGDMKIQPWMCGSKKPQEVD